MYSYLRNTHLWYLWLSVALLLSCCGHVNKHKIDIRSSGRLEFDGFSSYVTDFVVDSYEYGDGVELDSLIVRFNKIKQDNDKLTTLGKCFHRKTPTIHIDPRFWGRLSKYSKKVLMYHELGHCLLDRRHVSTKLSIMNTPIVSGATFVSNRRYLMRELFDPDSGVRHRLAGAKHH